MNCPNCRENVVTSIISDDRFQEIMQAIKELTFEAYNIIKHNVDPDTGQGQDILNRADAYWFPHIDDSVDGQSSMCSMQNTLEELRENIAEKQIQKEDEKEEQRRDEKHGLYPDKEDIAN